jgi:RNA polymerase sigma factor (sigma-70 family)
MARDEDACTALERKFRPLVWAIVNRRLRGPHRHESEDCYQTVWLRVFATLSQWEGRCPFCAWISLIAARTAVSWLRKQPPAVSELREEPAGRSSLATLDEIECIQVVAGSLPPEFRRVYELRIESHTTREIAGKIGKSVRTVQLWWAQVQSLLARCLQ